MSNLTQEEIQKLKPCPFCGGPATLSEDGRHAICLGCTTTPWIFVDAWNRRAQPAPLPEEVQKLKALALAATQGKWMRLFGERMVYDRMEDGCRGNAIVRADITFNQQDAANLDFVAAANPAAILSLIAQLEARPAVEDAEPHADLLTLRAIEAIVFDKSQELGNRLQAVAATISGLMRGVNYAHFSPDVKKEGNFVQPHYGHVGQAYIDGAREARINPDAADIDFQRAADGYTKQLFEQLDPASEAMLRTDAYAAPPSPAVEAPSEGLGVAYADAVAHIEQLTAELMGYRSQAGAIQAVSEVALPGPTPLTTSLALEDKMYTATQMNEFADAKVRSALSRTATPAQPYRWLMVTPEAGNEVLLRTAAEANHYSAMDGRTIIPLYASATPAAEGVSEQAIQGDGPFGGLKFVIDPDLPPDTVEMRGKNRVRFNISTSEITEFAAPIRATKPEEGVKP